MLSINRCLILLTTGFPYGSDEPFLESELPYLAKFFEKIVILAIDAPFGASATRVTPPNVEYWSLARHSRKFSRVLDFANAVMSPVMKVDANINEKKQEATTISRRIFLNYFEKRSTRIAQECLTTLKGCNLEKYDRIVIYSYWLFITARVGSILREDLSGKFGEISFISRAHRYDLYNYCNPLGYLPMRKAILSSADAVFACSKDGCNYLIEKYPAFSGKIEVSYLGTTDHGEGSHETDDFFHIISCSRLAPQKRIERIISSLEVLRDSGLRLKWTHIGGGSGLKKIMKLADIKLGFMSFSFLGTIPNKEVALFYESVPVSLFVNVSSSEGLPVSIMEAASFGIPAVATDVGGTAEIVVDGVNGKLIPADFCDEDLASAIAGFVAMPAADYEAMRARTRAVWQAKFDAAANYAAFSALVAGEVFKNNRPGE